jgi:hypothetical protein
MSWATTPNVAAIQWDNSEPEQTEAEKASLPGTNTTPRALHWVLVKKDEILALHSSEVQTKIFTKQCYTCDRFFKRCMFSHSQAKLEDSMCRWCVGEVDDYGDPKQFEIHRHIHCNAAGKNHCGKSMTMTPPAPEVDLMMKDITPDREAYTVKPRMSQKERKALKRAGNAGNTTAADIN